VKCAECDEDILDGEDYMFNRDYTIRFHLTCFKFKPAIQIYKLTGMTGYTLEKKE
jgi:hypothetical protein